MHATVSSKKKNCMIGEGDHVLLVANDGKQFVVRIPEATQRKELGCFKLKKNLNIDCSVLKGNEFFTVYEVDSKQAKLVGPIIGKNPFETAARDEEEIEEDTDDAETKEKDNRMLIDDNTSQKLSIDDIEKLKSQKKGDEIVKELIENSATFEQKTKFSKEKYIKRKKEKYCKYVTACNPSSINVCQYYFDKDPSRLNYMRFDALSELLNFANIYSNTQVLLFETCMGLVSSAVLERLFNLENKKMVGRLLRGFEPGKITANYNCVKLINGFPEWMKNPSVRKFAKQEETEDKMQDENSDETNVVHFPLSILSKNFSLEYVQEESNLKDDKDNVFSSETRQALQNIYTEYFDLSNSEIKLSDSLIIATSEYDSKLIFEKLFPYLQTSGCFAIFSPYRSELDELYMELKKSKRCVTVQLSENWTREYQILPNRCHPLMQMSSSSGFILSGIKVQD